MTKPGEPPVAPSTGPADVKRTTYLELFFDLVFVFAITQLAGLLEADHSLSGWGHGALMAWLVWWAWSQYTWAGNAIDLDRQSTQVAILAVTGAALVAAMAIPEAFASRGAWFAVPYVLVRVAGLGLYWAGLRGDAADRKAVLTYLPVASISPALVLVGGLAPPSVRPWLWLAAVVVDIASTVAGGRGEFRIAPGHFAERHALIVIIALGESVVALGLTAAGLEPTARVVATAVAGYLVVAALWWAYFGWVQGAAEHRLLTAPDDLTRTHLARDLYTYAHLPIVAGVVVFAVAVEEALLHPDAPLDPFGLTALAVGLTLFQVGFLAGNLRATGRVLVERLVAALAVVLLVLAIGSSVDPLVLLTAVAAVLLAVTAWETSRRAPAPA